MKRSAENIIVVMTVALAVSLLASACGPGNVKTLKTKVNAGINAKSDENQISNLEQILDAEEQKNQDGKINTTTLTEAEELASRLQYVIYEDRNSTDETMSDNQELRIALIAKDSKPYFIKFVEPKISENKKSTIFSKNLAQIIVDEKSNTDSNVLSLNDITAEIERLNSELSTVTINEKSNNKTVSVSAIVRSNKANANIMSQDQDLLILKDSNVNTRIVQVYSADKASIQNGQIKQIFSKANRLLINFDGEKGKNLSLISKIEGQNNEYKILINSIDNELKDKISKEKYDMSLLAGDDLINAKTISVKVVNKKTSKTESIVLNLENNKSEESSENTAEEKKEDESKSQSEEAKANQEVKIDGATTGHEETHLEALPAGAKVESKTATKNNKPSNTVKSVSEKGSTAKSLSPKASQNKTINTKNKTSGKTSKSNVANPQITEFVVSQVPLESTPEIQKEEPATTPSPSTSFIRQRMPHHIEK